MENNCDQTSHTYLGLTKQFEDGYSSKRLKEFSAYYANHLSFENVEELVERVTGEKQNRSQSVQNTVVKKALEVSKQIESEASKVLEDDTLTLPVINQEVDLYDVDTKFVIIFADGIQVKKQSESRASSIQPRVESDTKTDKKRVNSNIVLLERKEGTFEYITSAIDKNGEELLPVSDIVKSKVIQEYGNDTEPVNMVALDFRAVAK